MDGSKECILYNVPVKSIFNYLWPVYFNSTPFIYKNNVYYTKNNLNKIIGC